MDRESGDPVVPVVADRTLASLEASLQVLELLQASLSPQQKTRIRGVAERAAELCREPLAFNDASTTSSAGRMPQLPSLGQARPAVSPLARGDGGRKVSRRKEGVRGNAADPLPSESVRPVAPTNAVVSLEELERLDVAPAPSPPGSSASKGSKKKKVSLRW